MALLSQQKIFKPSKRKHTALLISEKLEILDKLDQQIPLRALAKEYGIGKSTVHGIKKSSKELRDFAQKSSSMQRKSMKKSTYKELDDALIDWYNHNQHKEHLSTQAWCDKAKNVFKELGLEGDFNASAGWFHRFKQRYGIKMRTEKRDEIPTEFCDVFEEFVTSENLCLEQIYNADATNVFWKSLPTSRFDDEIKYRKNYKEKITVLCCANAAGTHKVNLCIVGKNNIPMSDNLPVNYFTEKTGMIDNDIFSTWFHTCFVPEVCEHLRTKNLPSKVVLLLKKSIYQSIGNNLKSSDCEIFMKPLPPAVEPMDIYVIPALKIKYKSILMQKVIAESVNIKQFWLKLTVLDCINEVVKAWGMVDVTTLKNAWVKIFVRMDYIKEEVDFLFSDLVEHLKSIEGYEFITEEDLEEWYENDLKNPVEKVRSISQVNSNVNQISPVELYIENKIEVPHNEVIPHSSALEWVENLVAYVELQNDVPNSDKECLNRLRHQIRIKNIKREQRFTNDNN